MTTTAIVAMVFVGLLTFRATSRASCSPTPVVSSVSLPKPQESASGGNQVALNETNAPVSPETGSPQSGTSQTYQQLAANAKQWAPRPNTAEKLKRGLTNFMNHLNPAPFFVPHQQQLPLASANNNSKSMGAAAGSQPSAEPATIINHGPSADTLIKGPNRLVQARPLGGPLRWGRR